MVILQQFGVPLPTSAVNVTLMFAFAAMRRGAPRVSNEVRPPPTFWGGTGLKSKMRCSGVSKQAGKRNSKSLLAMLLLTHSANCITLACVR